jgi:hypothetical protein
VINHASQVAGTETIININNAYSACTGIQH